MSSHGWPTSFLLGFSTALNLMMQRLQVNLLRLIIFNCKFDMLNHTKFSFLMTSENRCGCYQAWVDGIPATTSSSCKPSLCAPLLQCSHARRFDDGILNTTRYIPNFLIYLFSLWWWGTHPQLWGIYPNCWWIKPGSYGSTPLTYTTYIQGRIKLKTFYSLPESTTLKLYPRGPKLSNTPPLQFL